MNRDLRTTNRQFNLSKGMAIILGIYSVSSFAFDATTQVESVGTYDNLNVNITSSQDVDAINPLADTTNPSTHQSIVLNGKTFVNVKAHTIRGLNILDHQREGKNYAISLTANDDVNIQVNAESVGYGILMGAADGKSVNPDGIPMGGFVKINGALTLNVNAGHRAAGVISGGFFGNSIGKNSTGTIEFGKLGAQNTITISGGLTNSGVPDDDKMVGILGYSTNPTQAKITAYGSTSISINTAKTARPYDINRGTFGVYAARNSDILFEDYDGTLSISLTSSKEKPRRLDGISSGLYDSIFVGNSKVTVNQKSTNISFQTAESAWGISSYAHSNIALNTDLTISAIDTNSMVGLFASHYANTAFTGGYTQTGGKINLVGGYQFFLPTNAIVSESRWRAINVNAFKEHKGKEAQIDVDGTGSISKINGGIYAIHGGIANLTIDGANSYLQGHVDQRLNKTDGSMDITNTTTGTINLTLKNGATWLNTDYIEYRPNNTTPTFGDGFSTANSVTMAGGTIDMSSARVHGWQRTAYQKIVLNDLKAASGINNHGHFVFDMNLAEESNANETVQHYKQNVDQLIVKNSATGLYTATINFTNLSSAVDPAKNHSENWLISQGLDSNMTVTNAKGGNDFSGRGMVTVWNLVFVPEGKEELLATVNGRNQLTNNGIGKGNWHLVKGEKWVEPPVTPDTPVVPDKPITPPEINQNLKMGTSSAQALGYLADLEDLRKRLGEVRYGSQEGGWAKAFNKKDTVRHGFEQETYGFNVGIDRLVGTSEAGSWLVGGAFRFSKTNQDGLGSGSTTGKLDEYSVKAYASWMSRSGSYADFVAQVGRYDQELNGLDNTGLGSSYANYKNWGYGASVELGHMFTVNDSVDDRQWYNHFFIEPQVQLAYFHVKGEDYKSSTGLDISQGDANFLTGRAGIVLGKKFNYGSVDELDRRYVQVGLIGGIKHEFLGGDQTISYQGVEGERVSVHADDIDGTRFYYGITADWQVAENFRIYAQVDREEGDNYTKDYDVSVGAKWLF